MEDRNLRSVAYGSIAGSRRAAWRIIAGVEQKEKFKDMEAADFAREGVRRESGMMKSRRSVMAFLHSWTRTSFQSG